MRCSSIQHSWTSRNSWRVVGQRERERLLLKLDTDGPSCGLSIKVWDPIWSCELKSVMSCLHWSLVIVFTGESYGHDPNP